MNAPTVFTFTQQSVRVVMIDDAPWFVATDVAETLDYRNAPDMTRILDEDEKGTQIVRTPGGDQEMTVINESGLYACILKSRKPEAKKFKKWVTSEVLPAIRKTGSYHVAPPQPTPDDAHETLNARDMGTLTRLVWMICNGLWGDSAWKQAVWFRLRQVTGTAAPNRFQVRHLPILASEVRRIFCMVEAFKTAEREAGRLLIQKVLRGGAAEGPVLEEAKRLMNEAVARDEAELGTLMERWHETEIAALTARKQDTYTGGHIASYAEPRSEQ